jgi:Flp pilus assembly protein CpaB
MGRARRWTTGSVVPVVLAVLAGGFAYAALQDRSALTAIVVASEPVAAGSPIGSGNTRLVKVNAADTAFVRGVLSPSSLAGGWVAAVALGAGQPITESEVVRPSQTPALGEMSISVPVQQAAGGKIGPGDFVDVIASSGVGGAHYVAQGLPVLSVAPTSGAGGVLGGLSTNYYVVVAVDKRTALRLAAALGLEGAGSSGGQIEIVNSTGEPDGAQHAHGAGAPGTATALVGGGR